MQSRTACILAVAALAGCGGGGAPKSDADAVAQVLKDAAAGQGISVQLNLQKIGDDW